MTDFTVERKKVAGLGVWCDVEQIERWEEGGVAGSFLYVRKKTQSA